jgi:hypothetical protein
LTYFASLDAETSGAKPRRLTYAERENSGTTQLLVLAREQVVIHLSTISPPSILV